MLTNFKLSFILKVTIKGRYRMNGIIGYIVIIVALILWGIFATFFIALNWIKQEERRREHRENDKDESKTI